MVQPIGVTCWSLLHIPSSFFGITAGLSLKMRGLLVHNYEFAGQRGGRYGI